MRRRKHHLSLFLLLCAAVAMASLAGVSAKRPSAGTKVYFPQAAENARPAGMGGGTRGGTNGRIINGTKAAALTNGSRWRSASFLLHYDATRGRTGRCGGTFVTARRIVTAAHCLYAGGSTPTPASTWFATSGRASVADIMAALATGKRPAEIAALIPVRSHAIHPQYNHTTMANDVAVLEVTRDATLQPTLLAGASEPGSWGGGHGRAVADAAGPWIAGWGLTAPYDDDSTSDELLEARVPIWSDARCAEAYGTAFQRAVMTCGSVLDTSADWNTNGVDSCQGDSGGPLLAAASDGSMRLVGITSFGYGCAGSYYPGIYTRVESVRAWIEGITGPVSGTTNMPAVAPTPPAPAPVTGGGNVDAGDGDIAGGEGTLALKSPQAGAKLAARGSTLVSWMIPTGVRATEITLDADSGASARIPVPAGSTSLSVPNSRFARGSTYLCVESVLERDGGYFASTCRTVTKGAQFSAGITSAMFRNGRITLNGRVASTSKKVTVKVRIAGGGRTANAKARSVAVPTYPRTRAFSVSVRWSGKPPRQLRATTTVAGAGERKTFRTTLR